MVKIDELEKEAERLFERLKKDPTNKKVIKELENCYKRIYEEWKKEHDTSSSPWQIPSGYKHEIPPKTEDYSGCLVEACAEQIRKERGLSPDAPVSVNVHCTCSKCSPQSMFCTSSFHNIVTNPLEEI